MPSAADRRVYQDQIPSFMSVFGLDADIMASREAVVPIDSNPVDADSKPPGVLNASQQSYPRPGAGPPDAAHTHHDSTSTQTSESTDSSPTTTLSTTDSSPLSDPSPSSSPDSSINLIPLNKYPATSFACQSNQCAMLSIPEADTLERPMTSPAPRRPRNTKGLFIHPPATLTTASATEPSSPCIKPNIPGMKRKPSQLSLRTSTSELMASTSLEMPASPAMPPILQRRALKHSTSSPHMLAALKSSTLGPPGGMMLPKVFERNQSGLSEVLRPLKSSMNTEFVQVIKEEESPIKMQLANPADYEPFHESVNNEDQKSPGYPDGPLAIYGNDVFLYAEPTAEQASRFDVVINVAREVKNPFDFSRQGQQRPAVIGPFSQRPPSDESPMSDRMVNTANCTTALEMHPLNHKAGATPTTPTANPLETPEYIHVPWDHNTDIAPDLSRLCELIENRVKEGKKILVHCQQGASRSASLIIAYGLYQNPDLSVNDAYYAAQTKSRWISPNMKLMYSLQDFHKELSKKRLLPTSAYRSRAGRSPTKHRLTLSADAIDMAPKDFHTAPLPGGESSGTDDGDPSHNPAHSRASSTPEIKVVSPGPASAPLACSWREQLEDESPPASSPKADEVPRRPMSGSDSTDSSSPKSDERQIRPVQQAVEESASPRGAGPGRQGLPLSAFENHVPGQDVPVERTVTLASAYPGDVALMSPRAETMTKNPLHSCSRVAGMRFVETPATPTGGLFSPRDSTFPRDSLSFFGRVTAFGRPPQVVDPRSPPTRGEAPIIRSIDDIL